jgi:hypothetical protein
MSVKHLAAAAACCVLAIPGAFAQNAAPPAAHRAAVVAPSPPAAKPSQWPLVLPGKAEAQLSAVAPWTPQEVKLAQARCAALLKGLHVVAVPEEPIREGPECGTAAPMKLVSLGKSPQVALSPPPIVTCDMIAALYRWLEHDVQPLARKHLGGPVIRLETMSSYSCRNAYGRARSKLSEHGKANALDIGAFITAHGQGAMVVADWGPTARQIAAQAAASKAEAEKAQAEALVPAADPHAKDVAARQPTAAPASSHPQVLRPGTAIGIPGVTVFIPPQAPPSEMGLAPPSRLGGPKPAVSAATAVVGGARMDFLRAAHRRACTLFNTVLGPEANNAHHNHFHVDMAERIKNTKICE